ncbi:MAG: hypothetical protein LH614_21795 [Pyrinomonadaceae bacterium]|nr:hypothetical protein [Pyrinomonadaceae bacterium]
MLLKFDCSKVKYPSEIRYVSGLVNLIHDIDEVEANEIVRQLKGGDCNVALAHILDSICKFTLEDYVRYNVCGVEIFEHKNLITKQNVEAKLESWLKNIPSNDLREIERIYILRRGDLESLGNYKPILSRINLVWINSSSRWSPMSWIDNFIIENTLYHEIGHHVYRHTFGQDSTQEKEADDYADGIMINSNHLLFRAVSLLKPKFNKSANKR